jgi:hypothetical protein
VEDRTLFSTFLVTTTADGGPGSLRQAILDSNNATTVTNTIDFAIPGQGVQAIAPLSPLPAITHPALIDGFSQRGYNGSPVIELSGSQAGTADGLTITGPDVTIRGLDINNFSQGAGIHITGISATGNWVYGPNPTLTLVANSRRGSPRRTLGRMGPPAKWFPGSLTLQPNSPPVSVLGLGLLRPLSAAQVCSDATTASSRSLIQ